MARPPDDCLWETVGTGLMIQWPSLVYIFWPWSPISPEPLLPQVLHSLIMMWKYRGRQFDRLEQHDLLISAEILFLLPSHDPLQAAGESRQGSEKERVWETCLAAASRLGSPGIQLLLLPPPPKSCAARLCARNLVATGAFAARETASLKGEIRAAPGSGMLPSDLANDPGRMHRLLVHNQLGRGPEWSKRSMYW